MQNFIQTIVVSYILENSTKIAAALGLTLIFATIFYLSIASLRKLRPEILPSYPFSLFFPEEKTWSVGYFLVIIVLLSFLVVLGFNGRFVFGPA